MLYVHLKWYISIIFQFKKSIDEFVTKNGYGMLVIVPLITHTCLLPIWCIVWWWKFITGIKHYLFYHPPKEKNEQKKEEELHVELLFQQMSLIWGVLFAIDLIQGDMGSDDMKSENTSP